ncbi:hypothetical protein PSQ90_11205 [Devosia rhodophyticola]|uniref:Uncharacterized protein n=1 Tax=Devosia rhodophyticola TaxID=3026423 RepID=A0ABY7YUL4_9HYPH|nr:hypothetical protein [Devosia rhodophyticola]WDR04872.1 hypothetical protein PSQ90_11205 [Devosia rhodophyticola]
MSDNVIKFKPVKKKPEKKSAQKPFKFRTVPSWVAWLGLIGLGCLLSAAQYSGFLG